MSTQHLASQQTSHRTFSPDLDPDVEGKTFISAMASTGLRIGWWAYKIFHRRSTVLERDCAAPSPYLRIIWDCGLQCKRGFIFSIVLDLMLLMGLSIVGFSVKPMSLQFRRFSFGAVGARVWMWLKRRLLDYLIILHTSTRTMASKKTIILLCSSQLFLAKGWERVEESATKCKGLVEEFVNGRR